MLTNLIRSLLAVAAVALAAPSPAFALRLPVSPDHSSASTGVIYACVDRTGELRVINPNFGGRCRSSEVPISWNEVGAPGPMGPVGPQGNLGPVGPAGSAGPAGNPGPTGGPGPMGPTGPMGNQGNAGPQGPAGPAGSAGPMGPTGPMGMEGPPGPMGHDGPPGVAGPTGPQGAAGPTGATGAAGPTGPTGATGSPGNNGPQGPAGPQGAPGPTGPTGSQGVAGATGPAGAAGPTGAAGPKGATGATGAAGATGPQGPAGFPNIRTVATVPAWTSTTTNTWGQVPNLFTDFQMANAGPVEISWQVAVPMNGHIVTRLAIDGTVMQGTNMVVGNTTYATTVGTYYTVLTAGTHHVEVQYRTQFAFSFDPTTDYQSMRLQVMSFDQ